MTKQQPVVKRCLSVQERAGQQLRDVVPCSDKAHPRLTWLLAAAPMERFLGPKEIQALQGEHSVQSGTRQVLGKKH